MKIGIGSKLIASSKLHSKSLSFAIFKTNKTICMNNVAKSEAVTTALAEDTE